MTGWKKINRRYGLLLLFAMAITPNSFAVTALDLQQAYQRALQNDPAWMAAQAQAQADREQLAQAEAQWLPNVSLNGSYGRVQLEREQYGNRADRRYYDSQSITLSLTQSLLNEPKRARLLQAREQQKEIESRLDVQRGEVLERVVTGYFAVLMADDVVSQLQMQEKANQIQLEAARQAYQSGQGTRTDIDEAQARLDMVTVQRLQAEQQSRYARSELMTLVGEPVEVLKVLDTDQLIPQTPEEELSTLVQRAEVMSAALRIAKAKVQQAVKRVDEVRGERFPTLDLFAQRGYSESDTVNAVDSQDDTAKIGLQLNVSLFDGGELSSRLRAAEAAVEQAQAEEAQTYHQLKLKMHKEFQNVRETAARINALKQVLRSAQQLVHSTRKGVMAGIRTTIDWLNANQQLSDAGQQLSKAQYEYLLATIRLDRLVGTEAARIVMMVNQLLIPKQRKSLLDTDVDVLDVLQVIENPV